jgi:hypothetical protein
MIPSIRFARDTCIVEELPKLKQVINGKEYPVYDPRLVIPEESLVFLGFEPKEDYIRLHAQWAAMLSYAVFIESLDSLPDISSL